MDIELKSHEQTPSKEFIIEKIIIKDKDKKPYKKKIKKIIYSIKLIILLSII